MEYLTLLTMAVYMDGGQSHSGSKRTVGGIMPIQSHLF